MHRLFSTQKEQQESWREVLVTFLLALPLDMLSQNILLSKSVSVATTSITTVPYLVVDWRSIRTVLFCETGSLNQCY